MDSREVTIMAVTSDEVIKQEADKLEKEIDGLLLKQPRTWIYAGKVFLLLSKAIPSELVLEEIKKRYLTAGWKHIDYDVYEGEYRLILTPKEILQKEGE